MKKNKIAECKPLGAFLLIIAIFGTLVIFHRCGYYNFTPTEFVPDDYGRFNFFSYFTVQSNIFITIYLYFISLAMLGVKNVEMVAFNPVVGVFATTYIFVTGLVYCGGIPIGLTPPFEWTDPATSMTSFIQVFHHMIIPPLMVILWLFPYTNEKISAKVLPYAGIYPLAYSIFSIIRGKYVPCGKLYGSHFYAYPFYEPRFDYDLFFKSKPEAYTELKGYLCMIPMLIVGIALFIGIAAIFRLIHNKRIDKMCK